MRLEDGASEWLGVANLGISRLESVGDGVHCAPETHTLSSSQHRQDHHLREHWDTPRSQSSAFKKESDMAAPPLPGLTV
jgi:hypothetical protein